MLTFRLGVAACFCTNILVVPWLLGVGLHHGGRGTKEEALIYWLPPVAQNYMLMQTQSVMPWKSPPAPAGVTFTYVSKCPPRIRWKWIKRCFKKLAYLQRVWVTEVNIVWTEPQPVKRDFMFAFFHAVLLFFYFWIPCDSRLWLHCWRETHQEATDAQLGHRCLGAW